MLKRIYAIKPIYDNTSSKRRLFMCRHAWMSDSRVQFRPTASLLAQMLATEETIAMWLARQETHLRATSARPYVTSTRATDPVLMRTSAPMTFRTPESHLPRIGILDHPYARLDHLIQPCSDPPLCVSALFLFQRPARPYCSEVMDTGTLVFAVQEHNDRASACLCCGNILHHHLTGFV